MRDEFGALALSVLAIASGGCAAQPGQDGRPVVEVGDREFGHDDFDDFVASRTALVPALDAALLSNLLDEFVREQLLVRAAEDAGIDVSEMRIAAELAALERQPGAAALDGDGAAARRRSRSAVRSQVRNRLLVEDFVDSRLLADLDPLEDEMRLEFESARAFYVRPESISLSELRFEDRSDAETARENLGTDAGPPTVSSPWEPSAAGNFPRRSTGSCSRSSPAR